MSLKMSENTLVLNWNNLTKIPEIPVPNQDIYGVYIWGFIIDSDFIPYYVGIADNITNRIYQHINAILGGLYTIYHRDSLANFNNYKNDTVKSDKSCGKLYSPNWPKDYKTFIIERKVLQEHINYMVDCFTYSYAAVDPKKFPKKDLKEIEKICINQIGIQNLANTRSGDSSRFNIEHGENTIIIEKFKNNR